MSVCRVALWFMRPVLVQLFFLALHKKPGLLTLNGTG